MFIKWMMIINLFVGCVMAGDAKSARYELLEKAMKGDMSFRIRAINEIGENITSKEYQQLLIKYLFSDNDGTGWIALHAAFLKADASIITQIINYYKSTGRNVNRLSTVCHILENIGGPTELVRQFYLEEANRTPISQENKAWLRICFLNRGIDSANVLKQLKIDLQDLSSPLARRELEIMSILGCQKYADKELIAILTHHIEDSDAAISGYSAVALATLKTISDQQLAIIEKNTKKSTNPDDYTDDYSVTMLKNMSIAALDKNQSEERVKVVLHNMGRKDGLFDEGTVFVMFVSCDLLVDKPILEIIEKNLSDSDPNVVRGALLYTYFFGYECKGAEPELFRLLENSKDDETRRRAADALSVIAGQEQISRFEKILKSEKSSEVRKQIRSTIHVLNMDLSYDKSKDVDD